MSDCLKVDALRMRLREGVQYQLLRLDNFVLTLLCLQLC